MKFFVVICLIFLFSVSAYASPKHDYELRKMCIKDAKEFAERKHQTYITSHLSKKAMCLVVTKTTDGQHDTYYIYDVLEEMLLFTCSSKDTECGEFSKSLQFWTK